jgi:hypothetical protein
MTEFELLEVLNNAYEQMFTAAGFYFTLVSAFLAMSYFAARKLTGVQIFIVSFFYTLWTLGLIQGTYGVTAQSIIAQQKLLEINSEMLGQNALYSATMASYGFLFIQILGLVASLYFMWSIRHPKSD